MFSELSRRLDPSRSLREPLVVGESGYKSSAAIIFSGFPRQELSPKAPISRVPFLDCHDDRTVVVALPTLCLIILNVLNVVYTLIGFESEPAGKDDTGGRLGPKLGAGSALPACRMTLAFNTGAQLR